MTVARNGVQNQTAQSPGTWLILHKCPVPEHPSESSVAELKGHPLGLCISSVDAWLLSILVTLNTHIGRMAQIIHSHKYDSNRCMSKHLDKGVFCTYPLRASKSEIPVRYDVIQGNTKEYNVLIPLVSPDSADPSNMIRYVCIYL